MFSLLEQLAESYSPDAATFEHNFALLVGDSSDSFVLVVEEADGRIIGYALVTITPLLHTNGSSAQLQELVVEQSMRGRGIGTRLIDEVERISRERGVRQLTVPSRRSADFYERLGYRSTADFLKRTFD